MAVTRQIHSTIKDVPVERLAECAWWAFVGRACTISAAFLAALVLAFVIIDRLLPRELPPDVREKIAWLAAHRDEYDTLFLGSSRVECHIIPSLFDHDLASRGLVQKSFNVGIRAMFPPQDDYVLDEILKLKLPQLRWIFIEAQFMPTAAPPDNLRSYEHVYWHDWPRFVLLCKRFVITKPYRHRMKRVHEILERCPDISKHVGMFVQNMINIGRGAILLNRWLMLESAPRRSASLQDAGWISAGSTTYLNKKDFADLEKDLEQSRKVAPVRSSVDSASQEALGIVVAKIQKAGATPVVLIPPHAKDSYFYPDPPIAEHAIILDFCDPRKYPEFYDTRYRIDVSHLNPDGAAIFTHALAEKFADAAGRK